MNKNADLRRQKLMRLIDAAKIEVEQKHGHRIANHIETEKDIMQDIADCEHVEVSTLQRYYSNWKYRKGIFAHLKKSEC
jgi:hypothetical protein